MLRSVFKFFSERRAEKEPLSDHAGFEISLCRFFKRETIAQVKDIFEKLGLPLPKSEKEFLTGTSGNIVFLDRFGLVIRVENNDTDWNKKPANNPWELQVIASFPAGEAIVEICPGTYQATKMWELNGLLDGLRYSGNVRFSDYQVANVGILPFRTQAFPKGVPIVIDRPAVSALSDYTFDVKKALEKMKTEKDPQEILYGDLRNAFAAACPTGIDKVDAKKMKIFWRLCEEKLAQSILVRGWSNPQGTGGFHKQQTAKAVAQQYARRTANMKL